jgi:hypothetical protein
MRESEDRASIRAKARAFEQALRPEQRKELGQFFSGVRLGKLLAHAALHAGMRNVLDPMAGHGDLLDASLEAATECGVKLDRLDGIEIDPTTAKACRARLAAITLDSAVPSQSIVTADAFDPRSIASLKCAGYDLVITNPPFVRYQARNAGDGAADKIRSGVAAIAGELLSGEDKHVWELLVDGYSGLADLSVPAWLLSALMVKPGGRLALVVPATWRSRDYADVIRYLLLRCFSLELIVEDKQPGWFSDALVRTHLIVAQRLDGKEAAKPLGARTAWRSALWLQIGPEAADADSLIGASFAGENPERQFAAWARGKCPDRRTGISVRRFHSDEEWASVATHAKRKRWYYKLESSDDDLPLFARGRVNSPLAIPDALRDIWPHGLSDSGLVTLEQAGIQVGQGLRTGCNSFFYVTACGAPDDDMVEVESSSVFSHRRFSVPADAIRPVLRRQSELSSLEREQGPAGRVLDLRRWVLSEDAIIVAEAKGAYIARGETPPRIMPDGLADFIRTAATLPLEHNHKRRIPELSAVRTNIRIPRAYQTTPRFWYMLPEFTPRHLPAAFVPRIIQGLAWVASNRDPVIVIDANFSTFWAPQGAWSCHALKAFLNSTWCLTFMEALGTPLGGGALKLEATHLRRIPVPALSSAAKVELDKAGKALTRNAADIKSHIDAIVLASIFTNLSSKTALSHMSKALTERATSLSAARQRAA